MLWRKKDPPELAMRCRFALEQLTPRWRNKMAEPVGFYTDTTVCIGCKACEVACHPTPITDSIDSSSISCSHNNLGRDFLEV